ncbi:MAG: sigma-54-dependent Fis family transcriptional regulator [Kofleriaceae bacterium]|nr:sigma-54-dependent Fis family transcriptional regulator [Kofleriaceae bacterium]
MSSRSRDRTSTAVSLGAGEPAPRGRYLLVVGDNRLITTPLPGHGALILGRDADCDVALPHEKISRRHARLVVDDGVTIEDLGSTNGIRVGGARLERGVPAPMPLGESVRLGPFTAIVLASPAGTVVSNDGLPRAALVVRDPTLDGAGELLERVARNSVHVLIQGETGTGKEVLARTLHQLSGRPGELVAINCAALTGDLLESELFGHERGAFTGATRTKPGLLEIAGRGTALLDEIGDLPLELQGKLLRALESRQVYRVGGVQPIDLHLRVLAATHKRLPEAVADGRFRQDLFFRLNGITLELPPLRERRGQIVPLVTRFLDEAARAAGLVAEGRFGGADLALLAGAVPSLARPPLFGFVPRLGPDRPGRRRELLGDDLAWVAGLTPPPVTAAEPERRLHALWRQILAGERAADDAEVRALGPAAEAATAAMLATIRPSGGDAPP